MQEEMNSGGIPQNHAPAIVNDNLQAALAEREKFLEKHPHLRQQQAEIDRLLDHSGNQQGRLAVLGTLMQGKLLEMQRELTNLCEILQTAVNAEESK